MVYFLRDKVKTTSIIYSMILIYQSGTYSLLSEIIGFQNVVMYKLYSIEKILQKRLPIREE